MEVRVFRQIDMSSQCVLPRTSPPPWSAPDSLGYTVWNRLIRPGVAPIGAGSMRNGTLTSIHDRHTSFLSALTVLPPGQEPASAPRRPDDRVFRSATAHPVAIACEVQPTTTPRVAAATYTRPPAASQNAAVVPNLAMHVPHDAPARSRASASEAVPRPPVALPGSSHEAIGTVADAEALGSPPGVRSAVMRDMRSEPMPLAASDVTSDLTSNSTSLSIASGSPVPATRPVTGASDRPLVMRQPSPRSGSAPSFPQTSGPLPASTTAISTLPIARAEEMAAPSLAGVVAGPQGSLPISTPIAAAAAVTKRAPLALTASASDMKFLQRSGFAISLSSHAPHSSEASASIDCPITGPAQRGRAANFGAATGNPAVLLGDAPVAPGLVSSLPTETSIAARTANVEAPFQFATWPTIDRAALANLPEVMLKDDPPRAGVPMPLVATNMARQPEEFPASAPSASTLSTLAATAGPLSATSSEKTTAHVDHSRPSAADRVCVQFSPGAIEPPAIPLHRIMLSPTEDIRVARTAVAFAVSGPLAGMPFGSPTSLAIGVAPGTGPPSDATVLPASDRPIAVMRNMHHEDPTASPRAHAAETIALAGVTALADVGRFAESPVSATVLATTSQTPLEAQRATDAVMLPLAHHERITHAIASTTAEPGALAHVATRGAEPVLNSALKGLPTASLDVSTVGPSLGASAAVPLYRAARAERALPRSELMLAFPLTIGRAAISIAGSGGTAGTNRMTVPLFTGISSQVQRQFAGPGLTSGPPRVEFPAGAGAIALIDLSAEHAAGGLAARSTREDGARTLWFDAFSMAPSRDELPLAFGPQRRGVATPDTGVHASGPQGASVMPFPAPDRLSVSHTMPLVVSREVSATSAPYELPGVAPMTGPATPTPLASVRAESPGHPANRDAEADVDDIVERAWRALMSRLVIEQERRGFGRWA